MTIQYSFREQHLKQIKTSFAVEQVRILLDAKYPNRNIGICIYSLRNRNPDTLITIAECNQIAEQIYDDSVYYAF